VEAFALKSQNNQKQELDSRLRGNDERKSRAKLDSGFRRNDERKQKRTA
jgi:hypothetical protein